MAFHTIRKVTREEIDQLKEISTETFLETFSTENTKEDIDIYQAENLSLETLTREVDDPESIFYFSKSNGKVSGYMKIRFGSIPEGHPLKGSSAELQRIYVLKQYQGNQVGKFMLDYAISLCHQQKIRYLWLGVWEKNDRAIRFYRKNGLEEFGSHIFRLGKDDQTDILMKISL